MNSSASGRRDLEVRTLIFSFALAGAFVAALCIVFTPRWEANDDVAMSMVAHGYGVAAYGSPNLIYSSVLWGYLARALPTINGVLGFSLATLGALVLIGSAILYFLLRLGVGYFTAILVLILVLSRPVLFPQFTITAGLLTCAAIIGWRCYLHTHCTFSLALSCCLAFLGFLVRSVEFALVLCVALPFLLWDMPIKRKDVRIALVLLVSAVAAATLFDYWSYTGSEWRYFLDLNSARAPFTDFGMTDRLLRRPETMVRYGLSRNDVELLANWFFVDRQIANPENLRAILSELGLPGTEASLQSGISALRALADAKLLPMLWAAIILLLLSFRRRLLISWILCLLILFALGALGRPGVLRVYIPLLTLLLLLSFTFGAFVSRPRRAAAILTLMVACLVSGKALIREAGVSDDALLAARTSPYATQNLLVSWGSGLPIEYLFPVLATNPSDRQTRILGLGVFTHAPFSNASVEERSGTGFVSRLRSAEGIMIAAAKSELRLLGTYCAEHYKARLKTNVVYETSLWSVTNATCH